jgi:folate-binding protein YgfZ
MSDDGAREYRALTEGAGLVDMPWLARLRVTGSDRVEFLQGMLSNDVKSLDAGVGRPAMLLSEQGRAVADLIVLAEPEAIALDGTITSIDAAQPALERFIVADDVDLTRAADDRTLGLFGPDALAVAERAGVPVPTAAYAHVAVELAGIPVQSVRVPRPGGGGLLVHVPAASAAELARRCAAAGAVAVGEESYDVLRIESGVPWHGRDVTAETLALEAPYEEAISFRKGCYLGQEVMERVTARGHVNRRLVGLTVDGASAPAAGTALCAADREVGRITSAGWSWRLGTVVALGYVRREHWEPGTRLTIGDAHGAGATVRALPL